jgi:ribosomal protein L7/L12
MINYSDLSNQELSLLLKYSYKTKLADEQMIAEICCRLVATDSERFYINMAKNDGYIAAIRQYRIDTGAGLVVAKKYIDSLLTSYGLTRGEGGLCVCK